MAGNSILYVATHGMEDSYRATLIFAAANAAVKMVADKAGTVRIALLGEATWLVNPTIAQNFSLGALPNRPQLRDLINTFMGFVDKQTANAQIGV